MIRQAGYAGFKRNATVTTGNRLASADDPPEEALAMLREALDTSKVAREDAYWGGWT